jgi:antirestriction protein ArdC
VQEDCTLLNQNEIRESITKRIVEALKQGKIPWRKPWSEVPDPVRLPTNYSSKRAYSGINVPLLWLTQNEKGYPISYWASFQQWKASGASVKKGEKATQIVFYRQAKKNVEQEDGTNKLETFPVMRTWSVFNVSQVSGPVAEQFKAKPQNDGVQTFEDADRTEFDALVAATQADIRFGHSKAAYYRLPHDFIVMPNEKFFGAGNFGDFAGTLLHELAHWTEHRLGWEGDYASGELRAEATSSFVTNSLGLPGSSDHSNTIAYVQSWIQALENDPKHIFKASAAASKAADFLLGFVRPVEGAIEEEEAAAMA